MLRLRYLGWFCSLGLILQGCATSEGFSQKNLQKYETPQELIIKQNLNQSETQGRAYVYDWGVPKQERATEVLVPRKYLGSYCQSQGGRLTLAYKSTMSQIKNSTTVKQLGRQRDLTQGIGAYRCVLANKKSWLVSIEPISDLKPTAQGQRSVVLLTKVMSEQAAKNFYKPVVKKVDTATKIPVKADIKDEAKAKTEDKTPQTVVAKPAARIVETPQQQQTQLYVAARRDINANKNVVNACNSAQRAYNFGKLQGTEGTRVYTESGMLVARCLTQIPSYSNRFPNSQAQAKRVLQNLASNYNHSGAKNMLSQLK